MYPVLLIAYRRHSNIEEILVQCLHAGVKKIYIHIDAPRDLDARQDVEKVLKKVQESKKISSLEISILGEDVNIGSAVSLISTCDLVFSLEEELVILEDDCVPAESFFVFAEEAFQYMSANTNVALFCGSQFVPPGLSDNQWFLSRYPFQWGWGTNKQSWLNIREGLISGKKLSRAHNRSKISFWERDYWNAGCRRALEGYADVWDTLFVREMFRLEMFALHPGQNLVRNLGNDQFALHTDFQGIWNNVPTRDFISSTSKPGLKPEIEKWIRERYFCVAPRHSVSTRITLARDRLFGKPKRAPLRTRVNSN